MSNKRHKKRVISPLLINTRPLYRIINLALPSCQCALLVVPEKIDAESSFASVKYEQG